MINKKNLVIVVVVFLMTQVSGMNILTSYMVDIFNTVPVSEFMIVLVAGLSEMLFSFMQMIVANNLGRKTFLILSTLGCSAATLAFAAIFWIQQNPDFNLIFSQDMADVLSSNIFIIICVIFYYLTFNLGIGPIKHTLLRYMSKKLL